MSMSFKDEFNLVGFFYIMNLIYWIAIGIMGAYWVLYFDEIGLVYSSIAFILMMGPLSSLIFEIPTGVIADIFGRKTSVFLSYLITGLSFTGILLSGSNIILLVLLYFIAGIAFTLETGALESWFVDTVKHKEKENKMHRLLGRWQSFGSMGFAIGPFIGGLLVMRSISTAFWTTAILMLVLSLFVLLFGREEYFVKSKTKISRGIKNGLKTGKKGIKHTLSDQQLLLLNLMMFLFAFSVIGIFHNAYQPFVVERGLPQQYLGFALSIAGFISVLSLNYSHKISEKLGGNKRSLFLFTVLIGTAIFGVAFIEYLPILFLSMVSVTVFFDLSGRNTPAFIELFNKLVPSRIRATVSSLSSFNMHVGEVLGIMTFGLVSDYIGLQPVIILAGVIIFLSAFIYMFISK